MEKVKRIIPLALLLSYVAKAIIEGPTHQEAWVIVALVTMTCVFEFLQNKESVDSYKKDIKDLSEKHSKLEADFKEIQSSLNATKLIQSVKTYGPGR